MNRSIIDDKWNEIKGRIQERWGKFSDHDVDAIKGDLDQLVSKLQSAYGYTKEQAEREFDDFREFLDEELSGGQEPRKSA
jgi:uncharacterized protein YjbJ (UPF0337 family)